MKYAKTDLYRALNREGYARGERDDCSVIAIAAATGAPYEKAHAAMREAGRKDRGGACRYSIRAALGLLGARAEDVEPVRFLARYPGAHKNLRNVTSHHPDRFPSAWKDGCIYLLFTAGHVLCVRDGENHDWTRGRSMRVRAIWKIIPRGEQ